MGLAPESRPFLLAATLLAVPAWWLGGLAGVSVAVGLVLFVAFFFRDPKRAVAGGLGDVVAPADGRIVDIREVDDAAFPGGRARRISIFLSIFNVHVNRVPVPGRVTGLRYSPGRFRAAFHGKASDENERNRVDLATPYGPLAVIQIAGAIARRIVCDLAEGQEVVPGQRLGLIRFGSRVDLLLPLSAAPAVARGDRVRTSVTIMAVLDRAAAAGREESRATGT